MEYLIDCRWNSTTPVDGYQLVPGHAVNLKAAGGSKIGWDDLEGRAAEAFRSFRDYFNEYGSTRPSWLFDRQGAFAGAVLRLTRLLLGPQDFLVPNETIDRAAGERSLRLFDGGRVLPEDLVVLNAGPGPLEPDGFDAVPMSIREPLMPGYSIEDVATMVVLRVMQARASVAPRPTALYLGEEAFEAAALVRTSGKLSPEDVFSRIFIRDGHGGAREIHVVNWLDEKARAAHLEDLTGRGLEPPGS